MNNQAGEDFATCLFTSDKIIKQHSTTTPRNNHALFVAVGFMSTHHHIIEKHEVC